MARKKDAAAPLSEFMGITVMVILVFYGGSLVLEGNSNFSGSEFMAYIILFARLLTPVKALSTAYAIVLKGAASADRLEEVLQAKNDITDSSAPQQVKEFSDSIEYKNVTFGYDANTVLDRMAKKLHITNRFWLS